MKATRGRSPALGSIILIGGIIMMLVALIGVVVAFSGAISDTYMSLAFDTPDFDYSVEAERGDIPRSEMLEAFMLMRYVAMGIFAAVLIVAGVAKVMEASETGMIRQGTSTNMISMSLIYILVIVIFPPMWDVGTDVMFNVSYWVLNPLYSFDEENPCPADMTDEEIERAARNSPYIQFLTDAPEDEEQDDPAGGAGPGRQGRPPPGIGGQTPVSAYERVCLPQLKVQYVFDQMLKATEDSQTNLDDYIRGNITGITPGSPIADVQDNVSWLGSIQNSIQEGTETVFTNLFLGLAKALVAIQVLIMALMIGIMTDMLAAMVAAGLPVFLMLSLLPKVGEFANTMIKALPALLLLPLMSALIIVVGAAAVVEAGGSEAGSFGTIYTWIASIGVVFFAITLPVIMVPILGNVTQMATQIVSSSVMSAAMVTGQGAMGAATAAMDARKGGGGIGAMMKGFAMGGGMGTLAAHGSTSVPGFAGAPGINPGQITGPVSQGMAVGHGIDPAAAAMPGMGEQRLQAKGDISEAENMGHTPQHAQALQKDGILGSNVNVNDMSPENVRVIEDEIERESMPMNRLGGAFTPDQQQHISEWKGPINEVMDDPNISTQVKMTLAEAHAKGLGTKYNRRVFEEEVRRNIAGR